ncbi:MAG: copper amine oxidase N-terminal domain-containing protein [Armatimonadetes bacterium]|nr:copper amine oxidase N-terminal domain-containing protein [Armatimonadota bacterium]
MSDQRRWKYSLALWLVLIALPAIALAGNDKHKGHGRGRDQGRQAEHDRGYRGRPVVVRERDVDHWDNRTRIRTVTRVVNNTTYVPVRAPFEQMGCQVAWHPDVQKAYIVYSDRTLIVTPGSPRVIVVSNGMSTPVVWAQPPMYFGEALFVPIRPVASGLGIGVGFNSGNVALGASFFIPLR